MIILRQKQFGNRENKKNKNEKIRNRFSNINNEEAEKKAIQKNINDVFGNGELKPDHRFTVEDIKLIDARENIKNHRKDPLLDNAGRFTTVGKTKAEIEAQKSELYTKAYKHFKDNIRRAEGAGIDLSEKTSESMSPEAYFTGKNKGKLKLNKEQKKAILEAEKEKEKADKVAEMSRRNMNYLERNGFISEEKIKEINEASKDLDQKKTIAKDNLTQEEKLRRLHEEANKSNKEARKLEEEFSKSPNFEKAKQQTKPKYIAPSIDVKEKAEEEIKNVAEEMEKKGESVVKKSKKLPKGVKIGGGVVLGAGALYAGKKIYDKNKKKKEDERRAYDLYRRVSL